MESKLKACVTSVGERTTELCVWALERQGFDVMLVKSPTTTLWQKLHAIYGIADEDFLRVDADIIINRNMTPDLLLSLADAQIWWHQFVTFDWYKQDTNHSMAYIKKEALPALRANIERFKHHIRPETEMSRIAEFYNPRRFDTYDKKIMGLHGYGIKELQPVKILKDYRKQSHLYDFELAERLNAL